MNDRFWELKKEKQDRMINAALMVFSKYGYYHASTDEIVKNITRIEPGFAFIPGKTLVFFDEMQAYPDIATSLKFFSQDGRFDVICSGSLLGINYKQIESISVGYKEDYEMYSMDFEEFLWARGYDDSLKDDLLAHMIEGKAFNEATMDSLTSLFLDYVVLGGMPEVVGKYYETKSFSGTKELQKQIIDAYREDIRKYADGVDQTRITRVFDSVPVQLAKDNKKFQISKVASGARFHDYGACIDWLSDAGIVKKCQCLNFPEVPKICFIYKRKDEWCKNATSKQCGLKSI